MAVINPIVARSEVLSSGNPKLQFWALFNGIASDVSSLTFSIYDCSTPALLAAPNLVSGPNAVNLVTDRIDAGHYFANFTHPSGNTGVFQIRWQWRVSANDALRTFKQEYHVV